MASQAVDKCQSREGVDIALNDIETFLSTAKECWLLNPKEFYNQFELILTPDVKVMFLTYFDAVLGKELGRRISPIACTKQPVLRELGFFFF